MTGCQRPRGPRRLLAEFRENWAASGEALERNRQRNARKRVQPTTTSQEPDDADAAAIAATTGAIAAIIVNQ